MKRISYEGIGSVMATFVVREGVQSGQVVKVTGNAQVGPCNDGDAFLGVAQQPREGITGVQLKGFVTVPYTGMLSVGKVTLAADGSGGVKASSMGVAAQVVWINNDSTAVICL